MDNDVMLRQFEEIERKVGIVMERCESLETENFRLRSEIERMEQELRAKAEEEKSFLEQKTLVRSKIDTLLARLEKVS